MTIQEKIQEDIKESMRRKDSLRLDVLRGMKTAIKHKEIEKIKTLAEADVFQVLHTLVKQRKDSIDQFNRGGRSDLVAREEAELKILESYLPASVSEDEIKKAHQRLISLVHPDRGGSSFLAAEVNRARDLLLNKNADRRRGRAE